MAGPTLRAMLKPMLLSATAPGNSARGTMSPTEACHAGALNAPPHPIAKVNSSSSHGVITSGPGANHQRDRHDEHEYLRAEHHLATVEIVGHRPRDQRQQHDGQLTDACTSATMSADWAIEIISQDAPTD